MIKNKCLEFFGFRVLISPKRFFSGDESDKSAVGKIWNVGWVLNFSHIVLFYDGLLNIRRVSYCIV